MAVTSAGDVQINAKDYLLRSPGGYDIYESFKSAPRIGGATDPEFLRLDNWRYWGSSDWIGMGIDEWVRDGMFLDGFGLDLTVAGKIKIAKKLEQTKADTANTGGYEAFADGTTRLWFVGKTDGNAFHTTDGSTWTTVTDFLGVAIQPLSKGYYKGKWHVSADNGKVFSLGAGGTTWTDHGTGTPTTGAHILGAYKGDLWVGYLNKLYTWNGTAWAEQFAGKIDGTPIVGVVGGTYLYFMTDGPESKLLLTDGNQLHHLVTVASDFKPKVATFIETLVVFGNDTDESSTIGRVMRLDKSGFIPIFDIGDTGSDYGIRSAIVDNGRIVWGANQYTGLGMYDPALDLFEDYQTGFYVGSVITSLTGVVHGIAQFKGIYYAGIQGQGIYKQTTPGTFSATSSLFSNSTKNVNKLWGFSEINHSAFLTGQVLTLKTMKDGSTEDTWTKETGTHDVGDTASRWTSPLSQNYKSPYIQTVLSGDANGSAMTIEDISVAFIEVGDNPKREWTLVIVLEGGPRSHIGYMEMRDGTLATRSAAEMLKELNDLWNTKTTFQDVDGTEYNVIMKGPRGRADEMIKDAALGSVDDLTLFYRVTLAQL